MSDVDGKLTKKRFSPKKKNRDRKMSISNSEFQAFYSAFEQHSKGVSSKKISESHLSTEGCSSNVYTEGSSSPLKSKKNSENELGRRYSINKSQFSTKVLSKEVAAKRERKMSAMATLTSKHIPNMSGGLESIVDTLKELENEISD